MATSALDKLKAAIASGEVTTEGASLDQEQKEQWAEEGRVFTVTHVAVGQGEFGPMWIITAKVGNDQFDFRMGQDARRDSIIAYVASLAAKEPVPGLRLRSLFRSGGNDFLTLAVAE